jgi:RNA polymerase subunit RPABC4/transcription elongation factor Spt4
MHGRINRGCSGVPWQDVYRGDRACIVCIVLAGDIYVTQFCKGSGLTREWVWFIIIGVTEGWIETGIADG